MAMPCDLACVAKATSQRNAPSPLASTKPSACAMARRDGVAHQQVNRSDERALGLHNGQVHSRALPRPSAQRLEVLAMALRMTKPWIDFTAATVKALPGQLGVYQLADAAERIVYIGFAGGRSLFGLRSELQHALQRRAAGVVRFRYEVNQQYTTRHRELLMLHVADHGALPEMNQADPPARLGRLSPQK
jgi:hypothetical protein